MSLGFQARKKLWLTVLLSIIGFSLIISRESIGNPVIVTAYDFGISGLFPYNQSHDLYMKKADVLIKLKSGLNFHINFDGAYYIYNPDETVKFSIAAPFSNMPRNIDKSLKIKANGTILEHTLYEMTETGLLPWGSYLAKYYSRIFAICNIIFLENSTTVITYEWNTVISPSQTYIYFTYDVGTGRTWNGKVHESVEYRVNGIQPYKIVEDPENNFPRVQIQNHFIGKSYFWLWENENINENTVGIMYRNSYWNDAKTSGMMTIIVCLLVVLNTVLLVFYFEKRKRTKGDERM